MIDVIQIQAKHWIENFSEEAHKVTFAEIKPKAFDRIDYALLAIKQPEDKPVGYVTVRELDHETVYWQFGGGFWGRKSILMARTYDALLEFQGKKSKRLSTRIENTNVPMIKLAISRGWQICGVFNYKKTVLLELILELESKDGNE